MTDNSTQPMYCYIHPQRETLLRCNRCEKPICQSCAVLTPTGYRCKECVRGQQKIFNTARWWDYPFTIITAVVLSYFGSLISLILGFWVIFVGPLAGMIISEAVRFVVRKRRSKNLPFLAAGATLVGGLIRLIPPVIRLIADIINISSGSGFSILGFLWPAVFSVLAASTVYYRLKGIRI